VAAWIVQYAGPDILVCHNARFSIRALQYACTARAAWLPALESV
jgi:hypothetical protein